LEVKAMKPMLQLHLQSESEKAQAEKLPRQEAEEPRPLAPSKRFNKFVNRTAHKAASHVGRGGSGIFTK
jgi:hypothetical protein